MEILQKWRPFRSCLNVLTASVTGTMFLICKSETKQVRHELQIHIQEDAAWQSSKIISYHAIITGKSY